MAVLNVLNARAQASMSRAVESLSGAQPQPFSSQLRGGISRMQSSIQDTKNGIAQWWNQGIGAIQSATVGDVVEKTLGGLAGPEMVAFGAVSKGIKGLFAVEEAAAVLKMQAATTSGLKAINLPGWKKVTVDMVHIAERHMTGGALTEGRSVFVGLNERGVMAAIQQAYGSATTIAVQGERILLQGTTKTGMAVQMWLNKATNIIETAYPVVAR
jgi:hypothetical protein